MEQPDTSPSPPPQLRRRDTVLPRLKRSSASYPAPPSILSPPLTTASPTAGASISSSEPTLRFPRPQGNKQLANWISSSNPDIMDLAPLAEDNSLSESTYELISGPSTDTDTEESQDDNYTGSMSESIGSLDIHRPDDVQSLAGTEDSYETESAVDEADMPSTAASDRDDTEDEEDDEDSVHEDSVLAESHFTDETAKLEPFPPFEHEDYSHSSLEYTQQSLGTPSFPTPEASRVIERPGPAEPEKKKSWKQRMSDFWPFESETREYFAEATWGGFPGFAFIFVVLLALPIFIQSPSEPDLPNVQAPPPITATITTTTYLTTSSLSTSSSQPTPSSTNSVALVPIGEPQSDDWIFGAKKPAVSFTAEAHNDILIHIPKSIKKTWLAKDCLSVSAKRGDDIVDTTMSMEDEGLRLKFAKKEVYGVVSLVLEAKCRPKIHKVVKVHFGKGLMEEALERTKHLAHDLSGLVPAAAQEAERCIENAKQSINSACQNVCQTVTETVSKTFGAAFADAKQNLDNLVSTAKAQFEEAAEEFTTRFDDFAQQALENLPSVENVQNQLHLQLIDAQLSARLWWLQVFGSAEEHDEYLRKATAFSAKKHAAAEEMRNARRDVPKKPIEAASRLWSEWSKLKRKLA
ncbi:hypothetical protein TGAM01_v205891 [Trichoderma gamsii]|uniref:Uncharacterized protein n=1 Tax=Trichoderma gamsii TaxID=398673 RepID=A0A2P4ZLS7_9HYPO|nr:hypothetical protein TGAM01_v205891 [Trichoderma gamsii]PON25205.1 hypothetical protein TGAM01_v205891 [Trichoderma gamsii]